MGGKCFLPYYACASASYERTEEERDADPDYRRWPYYVYANSLALHYGAAWFEAPIYCDDIVKRFKQLRPDVSVTRAGKDHFLGAVQMGHSYVQVTREFGELVRRVIDEFRAPAA